MVRSRLALTMKSSLGINRADEIEWSWPWSVRTFFQSLFVSHSLIVRSDEHETVGQRHRQLYSDATCWGIPS